MSAKAIWIHVGLVALLAGGVAAGILVHHHGVHPHLGPPWRHGHDVRPEDTEQLVGHIRRELDLTDEQTAKVEATVERVHEQVLGLTTTFHEQFQEVRARAWDEIRAALTPEQHADFEKLMREIEERHHAPLK